MTKIIAIEGIDGSGKTMQFAELRKYLERRGKSVICKEYPVYDGSFFGSEVGRYLSGSGGVRADTVDGKSMALWYALDRWEDMKSYREGEADYMLINRYVLSNAVYQSVRDIDRNRPDVVDWVFELEYGHFKLPRADVFVFYDVDTAQAGQNVLNKGFRSYVGAEAAKDVYEASEGIQSRAREKYLETARRREDVIVIPCMENGAFLSVAAIAERTVEALRRRELI